MHTLQYNCKCNKNPEEHHQSLEEFFSGIIEDRDATG